MEDAQPKEREILVKNDQAYGIKTSLQMEIEAKTVILSAGTFMRGLMHVGLKNEKGGRMGDAISTVSDSLKHLGIAQFQNFHTSMTLLLKSQMTFTLLILGVIKRSTWNKFLVGSLTPTLKHTM